MYIHVADLCTTNVDDFDVADSECTDAQQNLSYLHPLEARVVHKPERLHL